MMRRKAEATISHWVVWPWRTAGGKAWCISTDALSVDTASEDMVNAKIDDGGTMHADVSELANTQSFTQQMHYLQMCAPNHTKNELRVEDCVCVVGCKKKWIPSQEIAWDCRQAKVVGHKA